RASGLRESGSNGPWPCPSVRRLRSDLALPIPTSRCECFRPRSDGCSWQHPTKTWRIHSSVRSGAFFNFVGDPERFQCQYFYMLRALVLLISLGFFSANAAAGSAILLRGGSRVDVAAKKLERQDILIVDRKIAP